VTVGQVVTFAGYEAVFVIGPGWLLYRALVPRARGALRQLVFGWSLGYVLELSAFAATAALSVRSMMIIYPLLVAAVTIPVVLRRRTGSSAYTLGPASASWRWAVAAVCVLMTAYMGVEYFGSDPLPNNVPAVSYGIDSVWYLSLAADARHHWPVGDPTVAGVSLPYHWFASFDAAAISEVTGLSLPLVFFRLYLVPMVLLVALGLCEAGQAISRSRWVGPIAAGLALLVTEISLDPHTGYSFANELADDVVSISPSFLMGLMFFVPAVILLHELCVSPSQRHGRELGLWIVLTLLLVGCVGAKATTVPVISGGLVLYLLWRLITYRRLDRPAAAALAVSLAVYVLAWLLVYRGAGSGGLTLHPPGAVRQMGAIAHVRSQLGGQLGALDSLFWALATPVGLAGAYGAALCGLVWTFKLRREPAPRGHALLLSVLIAGIVPYLASTHFGLSQVFFAEYGVVVGCLLAAEGLYLLWLRQRHVRSARAQLAGGAAWAGLLAATAFGLAPLLGLGGSARRSIYLDLDTGLAAGVVAMCVLGVGSRRPAGAWWLRAACAVILAGAAARMLEIAPPAIARLSAGAPQYSTTGPGLTSGLLRGLNWVRTNTPTNAVLGVNNYRDGSLYWFYGWSIPDDFYYSAFAERRVFLEGWIYAQRSFELGEKQVFYGRRTPYPRRRALNDAVFQRSDRGALRTLAKRYGVTYLLVDRIHDDRVSPRLSQLAELAYANPDVAVYRVPRALRT
jgi:hypothetical protein